MNLLPSVINITQADIDGGREFFESEGLCPLGRAVERAMRALGYAVTGIMVTHTQVKVWGLPDGWVAASFPGDVMLFVEDFDAGCDVAPMAFEVAHWR